VASHEFVSPFPVQNATNRIFLSQASVINFMGYCFRELANIDNVVCFIFFDDGAGVPGLTSASRIEDRLIQNYVFPFFDRNDSGIAFFQVTIL
jgi:hypothetical protein